MPVPHTGEHIVLGCANQIFLKSLLFGRARDMCSSCDPRKTQRAAEGDAAAAAPPRDSRTRVHAGNTRGTGTSVADDSRLRLSLGHIF